MNLRCFKDANYTTTNAQITTITPLDDAAQYCNFLVIF